MNLGHQGYHTKAVPRMPSTVSMVDGMLPGDATDQLFSRALDRFSDYSFSDTLCELLKPNHVRQRNRV